MRRLCAFGGMVSVGMFALMAWTVRAAGETEAPAAEAAPARGGLYVDPYKNPLYATLNAFLMGAPDIAGEQKIKLEVEGFKGKLEVRALLQDKPAPLAVVLLGGDGKSAWPLGRLFPYWINEGLHWNVLYFDATFRPNMVKDLRTGVTGNFDHECENIAKIVAAFLKHKEVQGKVTDVGVVGYSLGATQAMVLARMAADGKLPFELKAALGFSPPVRLQHTARILDNFYKMDRFKFTRVEMGLAIMNHDPVEPGQAIPFEDDFMRAGIGTVIRDEFTEIVDQNDYLFRLKHIPFQEDLPAGQNRNEMARAWGFTRFMEEMCFPYWQKKGAFKTVDEMWAVGDMTRVMTKLPPYARAVVCKDDPFCEPGDVDALIAAVDAKHLVLPETGGHLGYFGSRWCFDQLATMFRSR